MELQDKYGRRFKKLRVSLTNNCNLSCVYCVPDGKTAEKQSSRFAQTDQILTTVSNLNRELKLDKVRLTGGEPLLHPEIESIISGLKKIGLPEISITTNGIGMSDKVMHLKELGLSSVNVSLDASNESAFEAITGFNKYEKVLSAIDKCISVGLDVKLNTVILKGKNEDEILPLLEFAKSRGVEIRFLELMRMGKVNSYFEHFYVSANAIVSVIAKKYKVQEVGRDDSSTTRTYELIDGYRFGIIQNESKPFCKDCDRLRLGSDHKLYGCITSNKGINVPEKGGDESWATVLQQAMDQKQDVFVGSETSMITIGG